MKDCRKLNSNFRYDFLIDLYRTVNEDFLNKQKPPINEKSGTITCFGVNQKRTTDKRGTVDIHGHLDNNVNADLIKLRVKGKQFWMS